jgi:type IV pilus assembly protein PilC
MEFVCRVGTPEGRVEEQVHAAPSEEALRRELASRGLHLFEVRRKGTPSWLALPGRSHRRRRVAPAELLIFNQEMAALLRSGLPVLQALEMMAERTRDSFFREVLVGVRDQVKSGKDLSDAFESFGDALPALFAPTLKAGERTGELEQVLRRYVRYQGLVQGARRKIVSSLVYPLVLIVLSFILIGVMTLYVVPRFTEFFTSLDSELPLLTRVIVGVSNFVRGNWLVLLVAILAGAYLFSTWKQTAAGARRVARLQLKLPLVGLIFHQTAMSEFCRSLAILLSGGIPVVSALQNSVAAVGNAYVRDRLAPLVVRVKEGASLHAALEATGVAPEIAVDMIKVGEATGALDEMLSNASDFLDQAVDTRLQRLLSLLEPLMLVFMGAIVAILLVSIYLPLFSLLGQMRG